MTSQAPSRNNRPYVRRTISPSAHELIHGSGMPPTTPARFAGRQRRGRTRRQGGFIFVMALLAVAGLVALMAMLAHSQRASLDDVQNRLNERRADAAAAAAVARAISVISEANANTVTLSDPWAQVGYDGTYSFDMGDGSTFRMQIVDAASLINLNNASGAGNTSTANLAVQQLQQLPLEQDQIDSLLDWIQTSTQPRSDGGKDEFYNAQPQPYNTKLGPLTTVDELLLVQYWTAQDLYQPPTDTSGGNPLPTDTLGNAISLADMFTVDSGSPNTQASGAARVNVNVRGVTANSLRALGISPALAATIAARSPQPAFASLLALPGVTPAAAQQLLNGVGFTTATRLTGKINLNTATQSVLMTIPNIDSATASSIVAQQANGFTSLGQLATLSGITPATLRQVADAFCVGSDTWIVRAYGESGGTGTSIEAVLRLSNAQAQVITWSRLNSPTIPSWWDWQAQPASTIDAGASI
jgi:type II secretory pathway component PulK